MNMILFKENELTGYLSKDDERVRHIIDIINPKVGDKLDIGIVNGLKGKMTIKSIDNGITFNYELTTESPKLHPITLVIGTPRPPVAKRLLKDITTIGIKKIIFTGTDLGEKTYMTSKLWSNNNFMSYVLDGAMQSESTLIPEIERYFSLKKTLESINISNCDTLALDNEIPEEKISSFIPASNETIICIGGERGFTHRERLMLKDFNYNLYSMGDRVLRTETACHTALGFILGLKKLI